MMCAEFVFIFARDFEWYIFIALLTGAGFAFASGAVEALVYDSLPEEGRVDAMKRAMGRVNSWGQIAFVISPIIGALIIGDASEEQFIPAIALTVVAMLIGLLVTLSLREPVVDSSEKKPSSTTLFRDGVSLLLNSRPLRWLVLHGCLYLAAHLYFGDDPRSALSGAERCYAICRRRRFVAGQSAGCLYAALRVQMEAWLGRGRAIALLIFAPGLMYWILAAVAGPYATVFIMILLYGTNDTKAPLFSAYQNALIESRNRATVLSLINMFASLF